MSTGAGGSMSTRARRHGFSGQCARPACAKYEKGLSMKGPVATVCGSLLIFGLLSQPPAFALTAQQELMKTCNEQAGKQKLTGDTRKTFMSDCLSANTPSGLTRQQELMKSCNAQATSQKLKGDLRKQFMSTCLKG
jgi:hypothetical protein